MFIVSMFKGKRDFFELIVVLDKGVLCLLGFLLSTCIGGEVKMGWGEWDLKFKWRVKNGDSLTSRRQTTYYYVVNRKIMNVRLGFFFFYVCGREGGA